MMAFQVMILLAEFYSNDGHRVLLVVQKAANLVKWMHSEIRPFLQGNILELGSGIATYSDILVNDFKNSRVLLSDVDSRYVAALEERFKGFRNVSCHKIDLNCASDFERIGESVHSAVALNVLEHVRDEISALNNVWKVLVEGGRFVVLVPAHKFLFNSIDEALGHYRRYQSNELKQKAFKSRFKLVKMFYFNSLGVIGWYLNGNVMHKKVVSECAIGMYDKVIPLVKRFEKYVLLRRIGLSLIVVLEK
jgi:phospholipid N-methyltransferase